MEHSILSWIRQRQKQYYSQDWTEFFWLIGLLLAAIVLFGVQLDNLPLRDWDEATVAQVAKEIWLARIGERHWLFPTLWGEPYMNKPPLVHNFIALSYALGGVNEWTARLPGAMLTATSVPLLYKIGREIFTSRPPAIFTALIYLTLLPVVRHGRLAMLDGAVLCFEMLMIWCTLRARRDMRWALGIGISFGLICLTKGMMGLLIAAIVILFLAWDTPRLLSSIYLWLGLFLGSCPVISWYLAQWFNYSQVFLDTAIFNQSLQRIWSPVENHQGPFWYYLLEIVKYSCPWLLFFVLGVQQAWENRHWGWGKLILVWIGVYLGCVSIMATKLPWYILPVYPALALAGGTKIAQIYELDSTEDYPRYWSVFLVVLGLATSAGSIYFAMTATEEPSLAVILAAVALTMGISAVMVRRRDRQFISMLIWGMYVSLLLFVSSPHWNWELNEAYAVKPIARLIQLSTPPQTKIYTSFDYERPSLNFYSERQVLPPSSQDLEILAEEFPLLSPEELKWKWLKLYWKKESQPFLLLFKDQLDKLEVESVIPIGNDQSNLTLITKHIN